LHELIKLDQTQNNSSMYVCVSTTLIRSHDSAPTIPNTSVFDRELAMHKVSKMQEFYSANNNFANQFYQTSSHSFINVT